MATFTRAAATAAAFIFGISGAQAADFDTDIEQALGLVVSGMVETWSGYAFVDYDPATGSAANRLSHDDYFVSGGSARLSLPLGDMLSIQQDVDAEFTGNIHESATGNNYIYSYQLGTHLSLRDPGQGLIGAFGGFGDGNVDGNTADNDVPDSQDFWFVGGEVQGYFGDFTLYVQGGYLDGERTNAQNQDDSFRDALFVRGVVRWHLSQYSRLEGEFSYADGDADVEPDSHEILEWGVRFDTVLHDLPLIGDRPVFVRYRGARFHNNDAPGGGGGAGGGGEGGADSEDYLDHTFMIGTRWTFGADNARDFERTGAGLDLPNFGRWVASGEILD